MLTQKRDPSQLLLFETYLHQELPRYQDDHPEEHRPRHQLGVAIGSQQLPGEVGHDEPHEGDGPHHRWGGHRKPVAHWNQ